MIVRVKLFAVARQRVGRAEVEVDWTAASMTVRQLREALVEKFPALREVMPHTRVAINSEYSSDASLIPEGAETALIPPVSGG